MANKIQLTIEVDSRTGVARVKEFAGAAEESARRAGSSVDGLTRSFKNLAATLGVGISVQSAIKAVELGIAAQQAEESFKIVARAAEESSSRILEAMTRATAGTIDDSDLMQKAVKAMAMDMTGDQIIKLAEAARTSARILGKDVGSTFDQIVDAVSTNMPRALKQMGLITSEQMKLFNEAISKGVDSVMLLDIVLANASKQQERFGRLTENNAEKLQQFKAWANDVAETFGQQALMGIEFWINKIKELKNLLPGSELNDLGRPEFRGKVPARPEWMQTEKPKAETPEDITARLKAEIAKADSMKAGEAAEKDRVRASEQADLEMWQTKEEMIWKQTDLEKFVAQDLETALYDMRMKRLEDQTGFAQAHLALNQWEHDAALEISQQTQTEQADLEEKTERIRRHALDTMMENWASAFKYFGQQNKAAFVAYKGVAIAQTVIETIKGAQAAFTSLASIPYVGVALGYAAAAAATVAGMARVAQIASMEPGGAAGVSDAGGGAVGTYSANPATGMPTNIPVGAEGQGRPTVTIYIQGDSINDVEYLERWAEKISKMVEDRDVRLIASDSKFADRLR